MMSNHIDILERDTADLFTQSVAAWNQNCMLHPSKCLFPAIN